MEPNKPANPYQAPSVETLRSTDSDGQGSLIAGGRSVSAGQGTTWIGQGWQLFMQAPLIGIVNVVIFLVIMFVLAFIPLLGNIAIALLTPVFFAGFFIGADHLRRGDALEVGHLFAGFKEKIGPLMIIGAINLAVTIAIAIVIAVLIAITIGTGGFMAIMSGGGDSANTSALLGGVGFGFLVIMLLAILVFIPVGLAFALAPALVVFHDVQPVDAIVQGFKAVLKNIAPFIIFGIIIMVITVIAFIPFALGLLVTIPLSIGALYSAYRDIFVGDE
jgi:hypothetical protein